MLSPTFRSWGLAGALIAAASACLAAPDKPVTMIVPFPAGATTDVNARDFAEVLAATLKEPIVVDNRSGAEGSIGAQAVLHAPADGRTILFTSSSLSVLDPLLKKSLPYDPIQDFVPICAVASTSNLLNVTGASPYRTVADLVAAAKAQPGKLTFAYASATTRIAGELFAQSAGIRLTGIPYRSSVTAMTEIGAGQVDMILIDHISAAPFLESGKLRPLAVAGSARLKALPEVPSAAEAGVPGYRMQPWFGVFASSRMPAAAQARWRETVARALQSPQMAANLEKRGLQPMALCGEALGRFQQEDIRQTRQTLAEAGIEPQ